MSYITVGLLSAINNEAVKLLKSASNTVDVMVSAGSNDIVIPPIPPSTTSTTISIPIFENQEQQQYSYSKIDAIKISNDVELSAYPGPNTMSAVDDVSSFFTVSGLSTQECMIYALSNSIIYQLLKDNKLVINVSASPFQWFTQSATYNQTFLSTVQTTATTINVNIPAFISSNVNCVNILYQNSVDSFWTNINNFTISNTTVSIPIPLTNNSYNPIITPITTTQTYNFKIFYCYS
jgi:hypothetical protein